MNRLLNIESDVDIMRIVGGGDIMLPADAEEYISGDADAPPLEPLRPYWDYIPHPWNIHLATSFATHLVQKHPELSAAVEDVKEHFLQRLETLGKIINQHLGRDGETPDDIASRLSQQRQENLGRKRVKTRQGSVSQLQSPLMNISDISG